MGTEPGRRWAARLSRLLLLGALVGAGCSRPEDSGASPETTRPRPEVSDQAEVSTPEGSDRSELPDPEVVTNPYELDDETIEALSSGHAERPPTPLIDYLGGGISPERAEANERERLAAYDDQLATCMSEDGFDYIPYALAEYDATDGGHEPAEDEYVMYATMGYGITTYLGTGPIVAGEAYPDPNEGYQASLSDAELEAYGRRLGICQDEYYSGINGDLDNAAVDEFYTELNVILTDVEERIATDPAVVAGWEAWSACMAAEGFEYTSRDAITAELTAEAEALIAEVGPELLSGEVRAEDLPEETRSRLEAVRLRERTVAQADLSCRRDLDDLLYETRVRVEQKLLDEEREWVDRVLLLIGHTGDGTDG